MAKSDLLKEAIADAKAIKETAMANAKLRMEEAFTPRLQSMISARLQNEIEGEDEETLDEPGLEDEAPVEPEVEAPVEAPVEEVPVEEPEAEAPVEAPVEEPVEIEAEPGSEMDIEVEPEELGDEDEMEEEGYDSLDLESIIKELEMEADVEESVEEPMFESEEKDEKEEKEEEEEEEEKIKEEKLIEPMKNDKDVTSNLTGDSGPNAGGGEQTSPDRGKPFSSEKGGEGKVSTDLKQNSKNAIYEEEDDEINLDEILKELEEAEMSDSIPAESNPFKAANAELSERVLKLSKDLKEHRQVIKFLKSKLNEVNLLNAKLLFTSKLFKANNMSNPQKMKVIESFDRAKSLREVKLVYSTIAESLGSNTSVVKSPKKDIKKITEAISGGASKVTASTKPTKVITESIVDPGSADRLKYLAGIKPKKVVK